VVVAGLVVAQGVYRSRAASAKDLLTRAREAAAAVILEDEILTMAANMAAATGEARWVRRYDEALPRIEAAIEAAIALAPQETAERFDHETRAANDSLVALELESFEHIRSGRPEKAMALLDSREYAEHKQTLAAGTQVFLGGVMDHAEAQVEDVEKWANVATFALVAIALSGCFIIWMQLSRGVDLAERAFLEAEATIHSLALNDVLTGLANRRSLLDSLERSLSRAERSGSRVSVLMMDLDRFKPINDQHGHLVGDLVLKEVARRLGTVLRDGEARARFGGDEFVMVLEHSANQAPGGCVGERLIAAVSEPMTFDGLVVQVGASVGVATFPTDGEKAFELLRKADLALYRSKHGGRGAVRLFDASMDEELLLRSRQEAELKAAIASEQIVPYYQPLLDLRGLGVNGFEVLARWEHPTRGVLGPAEFIPLAESAGLLGELTLVLLRRACIEALAWPEPLTVAINVSPQQIQDAAFFDKFMSVLRSTGIAPERVEIELTENALVADVASARRTIWAFKRAGVKVALDDFGTGYSSLAYLSELPFDKIKIDRSFLRSMHERQESVKVVSAIVGLGQSLGVPTLAEGVECIQDEELLRSIGCTMAQGFLYSKPVPSSSLVAIFDAMSAHEASLPQSDSPEKSQSL
jgi:diguanylate cyclase (GGDEF)-like protein